VGDHPDAPEYSGPPLAMRGEAHFQLGESPETNPSTNTKPIRGRVLLKYYPNRVLITLINGESLG